MIKIFFDLSDGIFVSIFSILIVFVILGVITGVITTLRYIQEKPVKAPVIIEESKPITIEDITDPDMMVAALVASIEHQTSHPGDVRIKSIKEVHTSSK